MGGLGLLILLIGYIWLAKVAIKWAYHHLPRMAALALLLLLVTLPFIDAIAGRIILKAKCNQQGDVVVLKSIADVEGIGIARSVLESSPSYYGYQYVEGGYAYTDAPWMFQRAEIDPASGQVQVIEKISPKARYLLLEGPRQDSAYFYQTRTTISDKLTDQVLASMDWFAFRGGWAERVMMAFSDAGPSQVAACGNFEDKDKKIIAMLHSTLQPKP